jgi:hypothetical protein
VLEIMRNIHVFVTRYSYDLHTQVFVERPGASKYVSTIGIQQVARSIALTTVAAVTAVIACLGIQQVARSIRTHGTGITHTSNSSKQ